MSKFYNDMNAGNKFYNPNSLSNSIIGLTPFGIQSTIANAVPIWGNIRVNRTGILGSANKYVTMDISSNSTDISSNIVTDA